MPDPRAIALDERRGSFPFDTVAITASRGDT
jgi:hypothetical protein